MFKASQGLKSSGGWAELGTFVGTLVNILFPNTIILLIDSSYLAINKGLLLKAAAFLSHQLSPSLNKKRHIKFFKFLSFSLVLLL